MTLPLFPELPPATVRSFEGLKQYLVDGRWRFYVCGFDATTTGYAGSCTVMADDDIKRRVPIDAKDRILIAGRWYGRLHWIH